MTARGELIRRIGRPVYVPCWRLARRIIRALTMARWFLRDIGDRAAIATRRDSRLLKTELASIANSMRSTILWVDPKAIQYKVSTLPFGERCTFLTPDGFIYAGTWDLFKKKPGLYHAVRELFVEGKPYTETWEYRRLRGAVDRGDAIGTQGCRSFDDIDRYFESLFEVYHSIRRGGYKCQEALGGSPTDEIRLFVSRDGKLILHGAGNHRHGMALLLQVESVPVFVKGVHYLWLYRCWRQTGDPASAFKMLAGVVSPQQTVQEASCGE